MTRTITKDYDLDLARCLGEFDARGWVQAAKRREFPADAEPGVPRPPYYCGWITPEGKVLAFKYHKDVAPGDSAYEAAWRQRFVRAVLSIPGSVFGEVSFGLHGAYHGLTQAQLRAMVALQFAREPRWSGWLEDYDVEHPAKLAHYSHRDARTLCEAVAPYLTREPA